MSETLKERTARLLTTEGDVMSESKTPRTDALEASWRRISTLAPGEALEEVARNADEAIALARTLESELTRLQAEKAEVERALRELREQNDAK